MYENKCGCTVLICVQRLSSTQLDILKELIMFFHFLYITDQWVDDLKCLSGYSAVRVCFKPRKFMDVNKFVEMKRAEWMVAIA